MISALLPYSSLAKKLSPLHRITWEKYSNLRAKLWPQKEFRKPRSQGKPPECHRISSAHDFSIKSNCSCEQLSKKIIALNVHLSSAGGLTHTQTAFNLLLQLSARMNDKTSTSLLLFSTTLVISESLLSCVFSHLEFYLKYWSSLHVQWLMERY